MVSRDCLRDLFCCRLLREPLVLDIADYPVIKNYEYLHMKMIFFGYIRLFDLIFTFSAEKIFFGGKI